MHYLPRGNVLLLPATVGHAGALSLLPSGGLRGHAYVILVPQSQSLVEIRKILPPHIRNEVLLGDPNRDVDSALTVLGPPEQLETNKHKRRFLCNELTALLETMGF